MKRSAPTGDRRRLALISVSTALLLLITGCEPLSEDTLQEFLAEFVRGALAAWLL